MADFIIEKHLNIPFFPAEKATWYIKWTQDQNMKAVIEADKGSYNSLLAFARS